MPASATDCGLLGALSTTLSVPVAEPIWVGVNVTLTLHVLLAASMAPQVVDEMAKSESAEMLLMSSVPVPVFFRVTNLRALVVLMARFAKVNDVGERC